MDTKAIPLYFYIAHLHVDHPLLLQKVATLGKLFTDYDPNSQVSFSQLFNGYFTFVVQSQKVIEERTADTFESFVFRVGGLFPIFSQTTVNVNQTEATYPPTFAYTAYFACNFSFFSYYFGAGYQFRKKLKEILESIGGGVYYLKTFRNQMVLVIESTTLFAPDDLKLLQDHLNHQDLLLCTSFCNF